MILALPAFALQSATVELYRGAPLASPGYWSVQDTYLDKAESNEDHGGSFTLLGGDNRTILIRFSDLARMVGPHRKVTSATLILTPSGGDVPKLKTISQVDSAWGEGPAVTLTKIISNIEAKPNEAKPKTGPARGAATWNERRAGISPWSVPGTPGGTPIQATTTVKDSSLEIGGLAGTVENWLARPWADFGVALTFEGNVEFFSSQSPSGRPRLVVTTEPVVSTTVTRPDLAVVSLTKSNGKWSAKVKNLGTAAAPVGHATWWADGKPGPEFPLEKALGPNEETTVVFTGADPANDALAPTLGLSLAPTENDETTANDRLDVFVGAKPVTLRLAPNMDPLAVVNFWNDTVAPQSRFSFAPEGAKTRILLAGSETAEDGAKTLLEALRQVGHLLGLPDGSAMTTPGPRGSADLFPGIMGYGDTRFEGTLPGKLSLPYEPFPDPATETALLEPTGLLSASDVGRLNDPTSPLPMPKATLIRIVDLSGRPLSGMEIAIEQPGANVVKLTTSNSGSFLLPSRGPDGPFGALTPNLSNGVITLRATQNGITEIGFLKAWRLSDAYRRSGSPAILMDVHMDLPMVPLERETDLARDRMVSDSAGTEPAKLAGVTDESDSTEVPLPEKPGSWIEIDLGRDRTIGEISLKPGQGPFWERFDIRVYATGQKPEDAQPWATENSSAWTRNNRADDGWVAYRAPVQRVRFVRIVSRTGGPASLANIRVVPIKLQQRQP